MKILFFSDLHNYPHFAKIIYEDTAERFLLYLFNYCQTEGIKKIFFLGDWFHLKNKIAVPAYIKSDDILRQFKNAGIEIVFLIGNHDMPQADTTDLSILYSFRDYGKIIPLYDWLDIDNIRFHFVSYTKELPHFEYASDKKNILCGHLDVNQFLMEGNHICENGFPRQEFEKFDLVFLGHYHKHQILDNIIYIGNPFQVKYSERHDEKGFVVFETNDLGWEFKKYVDAPTFQEVEENYDINIVKGNFVRIKTKSKQNLTKIKEELLAAGAVSVDFIYENENEMAELNVIEDLATGSMPDLSQQYIDHLLKTNSFTPELKELINNNEISKEDFMEVFKDIEQAYLTGWNPKEDPEFEYKGSIIKTVKKTKEKA